jgi:hypothetical protein
LTLPAISAHRPQPLIAAPGKCPLQAYRKQKIERPVQATILHGRLRILLHSRLLQGRRRLFHLRQRLEQFFGKMADGFPKKM